MSNEEKFNETKAFRTQLNSVSSTFCTAKWLQSTILLYNGETHSCHHPARHKIPSEGLADKPNQIHNTPIKIYARNEMLNGIQTKECEYCWRVENMNPENISDRITKSASPWAKKYFNEVVNSGDGADIIPSYVEVAFEATCNFACMYCNAEASSRWIEDSEKGPYKLADGSTMHDITWLKSVGKLPIHRDDYNPYVEAFWKWWPDLYPKLETFRITGGEPLLSKHTWKVFEWIKQNPNPNLEFAINTNLGVPFKLIEKLVKEAKEIQPFVKEFKIFTSLEATGDDAEYIRYGLNYEEFLRNINYICSELPNVRIVFMTTIGILSVFSFEAFLKEIINLRAKHIRDIGNSTIGLSINYVRWPPFLDIRLGNKDELKKYFDGILKFVDRHSKKIDGFGEAIFYLEEINQIKILYEYAMGDVTNREQLRDNFFSYCDQYDRRKGLNLLETFPLINEMLDNESL